MTQRLTFTAPAILAPQPVARAGETIDAGPLESLPAAWQCDLADDSLTWAPGVFALFGVPREHRLDRREIVAMYAPESRTMLDYLRSHAIATCGSFTFEARIVRADGAERWMRLTADTAHAGGRATHLYGLKQDITADVAAGVIRP
ncbi:PAS domain-containing protein [Sphingomonas donggukensis]|uniref:PAS domain-containing protein n=1 Tax=Sphingomonas donggukensis TaxID=2949093 RepID=A0ABY4TPW3_9SPHN|nr:PAS domain-containing protein [Sphingomonas donggukensis]URW74417.1 PAS domain-containing protein [Sphingomonas donggukensis]